MKKKILLTLTLFLSVVGLLNAQTNQLLYQYDFDGNLTDVNNTNSFIAGNSPTYTYTTNRNNEANKALRLNNNGLYKNLTNLPVGNNSRSISMWVTVNSTNSAFGSFFFEYGTLSTNQAYGLSCTDNQINNYAWGNDVIHSPYSFPLNQWKHVVVTYNQADGLASIYIDNVLVKSATKTAWNTSATVFLLGSGVYNSFNGSIDDLKIYNYALNPTEISNLFNYNSLVAPPSPSIKQLLYQFDFDGNRTDALSSVSFDNNGTFVNDRNNNPSKALNLNNTGIRATLANLPLANNSRTVSMWYKVNNYLTDNFLFAYGLGATDQAYGYSYSLNQYTNYGWVNDMVHNVNNQPTGTWKHVVVTYSKTTGLAAMYINGSLVKSETKISWNTGNSTLFKIGNSLSPNTPNPSLDCVIDDLKIYNYDLTASEVNQLYTNNTLSTSDFIQNNLKVSVYPNPVKGLLNLELEGEIKTVEIYNLQGQKVLIAYKNQVEVAALSNGMYMVHVQTTDNKVVTQKFIKE